MDLLVAARSSLVRALPSPGRSALLLEGSWGDPVDPSLHQALDDVIDGRQAWIDTAAAELAEAAGGMGGLPALADEELHTAEPSAAYLNALALRYYLVKLLRPVAYFTQVRPLNAGDHVELLAGPGDDDYAGLLAQICRSAGAELHVHRQSTQHRSDPVFPANRPWRRLLGQVARLVEPRITDGRPRVVFCGNPRLLGPACAELRRQGCRLWWLFDRFALKPWLRWRPVGVGQLVCDSSRGKIDRLETELPGPLRVFDIDSVAPCVPPLAEGGSPRNATPSSRIPYPGIDLAGPVRRWLRNRSATHGRRQTQMVDEIGRHFHRIQPEAVLLDEDATPMARAVVAAARRHGAASLVVQHGLPGCRFGFTPLAADRFLAWDNASAEQLAAWGMPRERIAVNVGRIANPSKPHVGRTSSPSKAEGTDWQSILRKETDWKSILRKGTDWQSVLQRRRILLLCTTPPRDARPDSVALHLTRRTYTDMLRTAFSAVAAIEGAELLVKPHPRTPHDRTVRSLIAEFPELRTRVIRRGSLASWLGRVDVVLSCGSTGGIEAAAAGLPVIGLAPPRATGFPVAEPWGLLGTATDADGLKQLLADAETSKRKPVSAFRPSAAEWITDEVIAALPTRTHDLHGNAPARDCASLEGGEEECPRDSIGSGQPVPVNVVASNHPTLQDELL